MSGIFLGIFQNIYFEIARENQARSISSVGFDYTRSIVRKKKARCISGLILCLRGRRPGETINTVAAPDARSFSAMTENLFDTQWVAPSRAGARCPARCLRSRAGTWWFVWVVRGKQSYLTASLPDSCVLSFIALSNQCRRDCINSAARPCFSTSNKQAK